MKTFFKHKTHYLLSIIALLGLFTSCELNGIDPLTNEIQDPNAYTLPRAIFMGTTVKISGSFIAITDSGSIYLRPTTDTSGASDIKVTVPNNGITGWTVSFTVPDSITEGKYNLIVKRGDETFVIKRTLAAMSVFANESFNRTEIEGDEIIISDCKVDTTATTVFGIGDEIVLKGIGFSYTDSLYFKTSNPMLRAAPTKVTDTEAHFIIPSGLSAGNAVMKFSNMPVYTIPTGYRVSYRTISGLKYATAISDITDVVLPAGSVTAGAKVSISGNGFATGDQVVLRSDAGSETLTIDESELPALSFLLPASYAGKTFQVFLLRAGFPLFSLGFLTTDSNKQNAQTGDIVLPSYLPSGLQGKALSFLIQGTGFLSGDIFVLGSTALTTTTINSTSALVTTSAANTATGSYPVYLRRGTHADELIGNVTVISAPRKFEYAQGGIVYWLDVENPVKGLVCHVKDATSSSKVTDTELSTIIFGIHTTDAGVVLPATSLDKSIGTGAANTQTILDIQQENARAAIFCDTLSVTMSSVVYDDWFIPSIEELYELFKVRASVNTAATVSGRGGENFNAQASSIQSSPSKIAIPGYMSSSAFTFSRIWAQNFQNDNQKPTAYPKTNYFRLRPVRMYNLTPAN